MAKKELTFSCKVIFKDENRVVDWEDLTEEEKENCRKTWSERLSQTVSDYYSNHLDQFERL